MTSFIKTIVGLCLFAALAVLAAAAYASPSGQEYLPDVPSATGKAAGGALSTVQPIAGSQSGTVKHSSGAATRHGATKRGDKGSVAVKPANSGSDGSSNGDSSGLAPIVLLIIGAVIVVAAGLTLRRRQEGGDGEPNDSRQEPPLAPNSPRTPDDEIVAGGDKAT